MENMSKKNKIFKNKYPIWFAKMQVVQIGNAKPKKIESEMLFKILIQPILDANSPTANINNEIIINISIPK